MKKSDWLIGAMCAAWLAALAKVGGVPWPMSSDLPAWVQAIGSVAAIFVSVWIAQSGRQKEDERRVVGAFNAAVTGLAFGRMILTSADETTRARNWQPELILGCTRQLASARAIIEGIAVADLPGEAVAARLLGGLRVLHLADTTFELISSRLKEGLSYPPRAFEAVLTDIDEHMAELERAGRDWLQSQRW